MRATRRWAFRLATALVGLSLLAGVELGLRVLQPAPPAPAPTLPDAWGEGRWLVTPQQGALKLETLAGPGGTRRVVTPRQQVAGRFMHDLSFSPTPEPGRFRVFCFGGSATLGVPFDRQPELAFPARLQAHLQARGLPAQVINLGGASFGSDQVRALALDALRYQPDALVIYAGNNEFFNYNLRLASLNRGWTRRRVEGLRLFQGLRTLLHRAPTAPVPANPDDAEAAQNALVADIMADTWARTSLPERLEPVDDLLRRRDVHHQAVVGRYRRNLEAIRNAVAQAPVPPLLLLVRVPANLLEPPWLSLHAPEVTGLHLRAWRRASQQGVAALEGERSEAAVDAFSRALSADPHHAETWYRQGLAHLAQGDDEAATHDLRQALELDMNPGRPVAALGEVLEQVCAAGGATCLDPRADMQLQGHPGACQAIFHDSCHLNARGYDLLAQQVATALQAAWRPAAP